MTFSKEKEKEANIGKKKTKKWTLSWLTIFILQVVIKTPKIETIKAMNFFKVISSFKKKTETIIDNNNYLTTFGNV